MGQLNAAIVGYGLAGATFHGPLIAATPEMKVATVVTGNRERRPRRVDDRVAGGAASRPVLTAWRGPLASDRGCARAPGPRVIRTAADRRPAR